MDPSTPPLNKTNQDMFLPQPTTQEETFGKLLPDLIGEIFKAADSTKDRNIMSSTSKAWNMVGLEFNKADFNETINKLEAFARSVVKRENAKSDPNPNIISKANNILEKSKLLSQRVTNYGQFVEIFKKILLEEEINMSDYIPKEAFEEYSQMKAKDQNYDQTMLEEFKKMDQDKLLNQAKEGFVTLQREIASSLNVFDKAELETLKSEGNLLMSKSIVNDSIMTRAENEFEYANFARRQEIVSELAKDGFDNDNPRIQMMKTTLSYGFSNLDIY
jgi:hypothetical protein